MSPSCAVPAAAIRQRAAAACKASDPASPCPAADSIQGRGQAIAEAGALTLYADQRFKSEVEPLRCRLDQPVGAAESGPAVDGLGAICAGGRVELPAQLVAGAPNVGSRPRPWPTRRPDRRHLWPGAERCWSAADCGSSSRHGAYLAWSQGSAVAAKFIHLTYGR